MKPRQFFYILLGMAAALVVMGGLSYYWASQTVQREAQSLRAKLASVAVADEQISQLIGLKQQYQKLTPLLPKIEAVVPKTKKEAEVALQIQELAARSGMSLPSINFVGTSALPSTTSQTVKAGDILAIPINFQLVGTYDQLQSFLQNLERLNRYTSITNLNLALTEPKTRKLTLQFNISVFVKP